MADEILTARRSIPAVIELIQEKTQDKITAIHPLQNDRHFLFITDKGMKFYMVFKREFFMSFGKIFNMKGIGESLNEEIVHYAVEKGIHNFLFVYEDGKIYTIPAKEFKDYAISHKTIRTTSSGEGTMSIPVGLLSRWK